MRKNRPRAQRPATENSATTTRGRWLTSSAPIIFYMIKIKVDVTKIDKSKIFVGAKGKYIDICIIEKREQDAYGNDFVVVQDVSKEEREKGIKGAILGNGRTIGQGPSKTRDITPKDDITSTPRKPTAGAMDEDVPW